MEKKNKFFSYQTINNVLFKKVGKPSINVRIILPYENNRSISRVFSAGDFKSKI